MTIQELKVNSKVLIGDSSVKTVTAGLACPLFLIAGPCVIESREHALFMAEKINDIAGELAIPLIFKASYDKANRTSQESFRGLGREQGLEILAEIRRDIGIPVLTDVHSEKDVTLAAEVVDILQIPAFLCRQTDLLIAAGASRKPVIVKKGQFLAPQDMRYAAEKILSSGNSQILFCERGNCFGYRDLVVDFKSLSVMSKVGCPVVFDATHSVQSMGGGGGVSSGSREFVPLLARAAVAVGIQGIFLECHDNPDQALSDGPNMIPLDSLKSLLSDLKLLSELNLETRVIC